MLKDCLWQGEYAAAAREYTKALRYLDLDLFEDQEGVPTQEQSQELAKQCTPLLLNR